MYRMIQRAGNFAEYNNMGGFASLIIGVLFSLLLFNAFVVPLHNYIKYTLIHRFGDVTGVRDGLRTMNPIKNVHFVGLLMSLTLTIGFSAPTYYDTMEFKRPRLYSFLVSMSGILCYLFCFGFFFSIYSLLNVFNLFGISRLGYSVALSGAFEYIYYVAFITIYYLAASCLLAGLFNLLPLFPLDMGDALYAFLPLNWQDALRNNELLISLGLFVSGFLSFGKTGGFLINLSSDVMSFCLRGVRYLVGIFV